MYPRLLALCNSHLIRYGTAVEHRVLPPWQITVAERLVVSGELSRLAPVFLTEVILGSPRLWVARIYTWTSEYVYPIETSPHPVNPLRPIA